jgi:hypothetical protein
VLILLNKKYLKVPISGLDVESLRPLIDRSPHLVEADAATLRVCALHDVWCAVAHARHLRALTLDLVTTKPPLVSFRYQPKAADSTPHDFSTSHVSTFKLSLLSKYDDPFPSSPHSEKK